MQYPTDRIAYTTAFVIPIMKHWLEQEIALTQGYISLHYSTARPAGISPIKISLKLTQWNGKKPAFACCWAIFSCCEEKDI